MLINWHLQGEELKHNITQSLHRVTNTSTHFLIFRFPRILSHLMVRYVYFWTAGSLSCFWQQSSRSIHWISLKTVSIGSSYQTAEFECSSVCIIECCSSREYKYFCLKNHIFNFLFAKTKFLQLNIFLVGSSWNWQTSWLNWQALSNAVCFSCEKCKFIFWKLNWIFVYTLFHTIRVTDYWVFTIQSDWCCNVRSNCKLAMLRDFDT